MAGSRSNSLRFTSLRQSRAPIRQTLRSSAHPEGQGEPNIHTGLCFARPSLRSAWRLRPQDEAERSNGPNGCWLFGYSAIPPLLAAPAAWQLWGGMGVGAPMLRALTRRGCPSGARSAKRVPRRTPQPPRRRLAPTLSVGVADSGSPFFCLLFFGDFLLAKQKKVTRMPGDSRLPPSKLACSSHYQNE